MANAHEHQSGVCPAQDAAPQDCNGRADATGVNTERPDAADAYLRTIITLARAVQARDPYAAGRSERVTRLAQRIAAELGLAADHNHAIAVGVVCADIGKIGLPDRLLHGRGHLSESDYAILRSYPAISSFILAELELPEIVKEMARSHLERWDGRGGPDHLAGESIPLFARVLSVADAIDHKVAGGQALPPAFAEIQAESATRFCPTVVDAAHRCLAADPALRDYIAA
jgi:HD-GYP domain-containing protein (c-di-GMP phosphodiesterase class II)